MKKSGGRSEAEIRRLIAGYENGNQSRTDYCAAHGVPVTTLDYYRRRHRREETGLVEIDLGGSDRVHGEDRGILVELGNGRRVVIGWAGLVRVADHGQSLRALLALLEQA